MNYKNVLLFLISVIISFFLCESILRIYPSILSDKLIFKLPYGKVRDDFFKRVFKIDKERIEYIYYEKDKKIPLYQNNIDWKSHRIDSDWGALNISYYNKGFCEPDINKLKKNFKNNINAIAVGDSFTYCFALSPHLSWPSKLGNLNGEIDTKVFNLGIKGQGPYQYYYILKKYINKNTKHIFVGWYEGNDLRDIIKYFSSEANKELSEIKTLVNKKKLKEKSLRKIITSLLRESYFINFVYATGVGEIYQKVFGIDTNEKQITNFRYSYINQDREVNFNIENSDTDEIFYANKMKEMENSNIFLYKKFYDPLYKIRNLANIYNSKIHLVYIPSAYNAFGENIRFEGKDYGKILSYFHKLQKKTLKKISKELEINFIDTSKRIIKFNDSNPKILTHFPVNVHLTEKGHEVISYAILDALK